MKYLMAVVLVLVMATCVYGEQRYNAFENRWETVPDNSNWTPQYNAYENEWKVQPQNAQIEYNAFENKFEFVPQEVPQPKNTWGWND